tara:strand:+ start:2854 stop:3222 length:369 start_codon:yes stop_codon:yes gene_type:complete
VGFYQLADYERKNMKRKPPKYRNQAVIIDGVRFASKKEGERYKILSLLESQGRIDNLRLQPRIALMVNGVKIGHYVADFQYDLSGKTVIEDVKSPATKTPIYKIKKKILETYDPPVVITEVY